jgi:hypothetical protein
MLQGIRIPRSTPVPIQLASFTGVVVNQNLVRLNWSTLTEINNYGFEVQKSPATLNNYQTIPGSLVPGHGTTNVPQYYSYVDTTASLGTWYYRMKQIDLDGTIHYTDAIQVDVVTSVKEKSIPSVFSLNQNYPNPFNPSTVIEFGFPTQSSVNLEVFSVLGEKVATIVNDTRPAGFYSVRFDAMGLASGLYFYRLESNGFVDTKMVLLVR